MYIKNIFRTSVSNQQYLLKNLSQYRIVQFIENFCTVIVHKVSILYTVQWEQCPGKYQAYLISKLSNILSIETYTEWPLEFQFSLKDFNILLLKFAITTYISRVYWRIVNYNSQLTSLQNSGNVSSLRGEKSCGFCDTTLKIYTSLTLSPQSLKPGWTFPKQHQLLLKFMRAWTQFKDTINSK